MQGLRQYPRSPIWTWKECRQDFRFLKTGIKFPRSLPVVNESSVVHQKLLSLLGLRLNLAGQVPRKLFWKKSRFFSRFFPDFGPNFKTRLQETVRSWVFQKCLPRIRLSLYEYFSIGPDSGIDLFDCYWWTTAAKLFAISFLVATFFSNADILSPIFLTQEFMVMGAAPFESPPSPLSDGIVTFLYFCLKIKNHWNPKHPFCTETRTNCTDNRTGKSLGVNRNSNIGQDGQLN